MENGSVVENDQNWMEGLPVVEDTTCRLFSQAARRLMITRSEDKVRGDGIRQ